MLIDISLRLCFMAPKWLRQFERKASDKRSAVEKLNSETARFPSRETTGHELFPLPSSDRLEFPAATLNGIA